MKTTFTIKAILSEGKLTVKATATKPYGSSGRTANVTIDLDGDFKGVEGELKRILSQNEEALEKLAEVGAAESLVAAVRLKEM